ncbi:MAG: Eco57I restriction-modification methylase domain-containing protein [Actinobacteria bacterium]|nr:Eco57I restriction-modification methylase domain-containing protein [Actinomycetota bacterium]
MSAPDKVLELVEIFNRNREAYLSGVYSEAQVRLEFIDPFFKSLDWDMYNEKGYAEAYKDVIPEDAIKIGGVTKAPDYCFRIGGARKFFVEAKKPSVDLRDDISPAYQLRRYAWSGKLPLSVLTDFEEFAVYDCRIKPVKTDTAATARTLYMPYTDYENRWDDIASIFSRDEVLKGSFDKYAESTKRKRGTAEVDDVFLEEIESWRDMLARNIALRNPGLTTRELNYAVQRTIDRIIFLRICEDRGIEDYGKLMALQNGANVYPRLCDLFVKADERYNSGLFHFRHEKERPEAPDELTLGLTIDDKVLKELIKRLYYPDSPYEFSVLPANILGQVYEQFLGKVIRLTPKHRAVVEDKPEVKKAGGVYYTPTYIVDYIVKNTVGELLEGKTPKTASKLRILDPACGSGSFLIGAYQYLLDWHRDWYTGSDPEKWAKGRSPRIYEGPGGDYRLATGERKRILLNNIYGVDIDPQAVEVTKLSLFLKILEGENEQTLAKQLQLFQERALPDLSENIKCGNSLIGPDFYEDQQMSMLDEEERYLINVFDWNTEFPEVISGGGFDIVIGNPPYVRQEMLGQLKGYFKEHYETYHGIADIYVYFIERGVSLLKPGGLFGIIVANKWMRANYGKPLRRWMKSRHIKEITDFGDLPVFPKETTYPCILLICESQPASAFQVTILKNLEPDRLEEHIEEQCYPVKQGSLEDKGWSLVNEQTRDVISKLYGAGVELGIYVEGKIYYGIKTGLNRAFVIDGETRNRLISDDESSAELIKPVLAGRDIGRYAYPKSDRYLILVPCGWTRAHSGNTRDAWRWFQNECPTVAKHLKRFDLAATNRYDKGEYWWELRPCDYYEAFEKQKIMLPDIAARGRFTLDIEGRYYCLNTAYIISSIDRYLLGILNSKLIAFFYGNISSKYRGGYLRFIYQYLSEIPIRIIDFSKPTDIALHKRTVELVEQLLELHKQLAGAKTPGAKTAIQRQIDATDRQTDNLVYELYRLTEEEIKIVEEATK